MTTRRDKNARGGRNKSRKQRKMQKTKTKTKTGKRWTSAISAASKTLTQTRSLTAARESLRRQALLNARKLFGAVGV
jgi:hypothetical protein